MLFFGYAFFRPGGARRVPSCPSSRCTPRHWQLDAHSVTYGDGGHLFGDVDSYGAPDDAPAATDTTGGIELIPPRREFVRYPLPIPRGRRFPHRSPVKI